MSWRKEITGLLLGTMIVWTAAQSSAQSSPSSASPNSPAAPPAAPASTAKDKAKTPPSAPDSPQQAQNPAPPATPAKKPSTADDNPFPEDVSRKAAADAKAATAPSYPASAPRGSSSLDGMDKLGLDDPARRQLKLESPDGSSDAYDPKRAAEDVKVGKFYLKTGNFKGALERFKDAATFDHENADAIFWMAEAARKMNLHQEAAQEYQVYLDAVPEGPNAKAARKALGELAAVSKP